MSETYSIVQNPPKEIFRTYDVRGIVGKTLSPEIVYTIGRAIGSQALEAGISRLVIGRDGRLSGPSLLEALSAGICESGCDVINVSEVPTPVLYFALYHLKVYSGVMLTGSHNPTDYNGLKFVLAEETLSGEEIQGLYQRIAMGDFLSGEGKATQAEVIEDYIERIVSDIQLKRKLKIVIDCGNGVGGCVAPELFKRLGCEVVELFCEVDGRFPNHHPDPLVPENMRDLQAAVQTHGADIGLAFDGDADRLGMVTNEGKIVWPDRQMMLFSMDLLSRHPNADILFDVKCTRHLARIIRKHGGRPLLWKTGHSLLKKKMREMGALLAGELSGHLCFKERWYGFDDGLYSGVRLLELLARDGRSIVEMCQALPDSVNTPELKLSMAEERKAAFMEGLITHAAFPNAEINTIDGLRVDFPDGFALIRPSNTTPCLVMRFEADTEEGLVRIQDDFRNLLQKVDPDLSLPF